MVKSLLFVPAKEKMLNKILELNSDGYIIDLEDSIMEEEKGSALNTLFNFLSTHLSIPNIYVRLNKNNFTVEAKVLNTFNIGFMLPKFEKTKEYAKLDNIWKQHFVIALVETPLGVINASEIVQCPWIDALAFGAEDYTANMNMMNKDDILLPVKSTLVNYAKAYNKLIYDTPSFNISEQNAFEKDVLNSVSLGFDGKLLINPKQIQFVNKTFGEIDLEHLVYIISEYEKRGEAVVIIDGKVYEKMHINRYRRIIKEHKDREQ